MKISVQDCECLGECVEVGDFVEIVHGEYVFKAGVWK